MLKTSENNGTEEIGLVTPTPDVSVLCKGRNWISFTVIGEITKYILGHEMAYESITPYAFKMLLLGFAMKMLTASFVFLLLI